VGIKMKTYTFAIQKGGTGKTSVSVSVAVELAKLGRTILIDADPQGNTTDWMNLPKLEYELSDVLSDKCTIKDVIQPTQVENLFIIPTAGIDGGLRTYQETIAQKEQFKLAQLKNELSAAFDYCVIDTSPALGAIERSCFAASDEVVPVLQLNQFSVDGLTIFTNNLAQIKKDMRLGNKPVLSKIILNGYDARIAQQNDNLAKFKAMKMPGIDFFILPTDQAFSKSQKFKVAPQDQPATNAKKETMDVLKDIAAALSK
jgi:chromosome partitioning protein